MKRMSYVTRLKKRLYYILARYFRFFADISLRRWQPRVVAVTGSVGKTTLLNLLEVQLGSKAHYSHGANSAYGIAFDILGLAGITNSRWRWLYLFVAVPLRSLYFSHKQPIFVVEIDADRPYEAEFLASWLRPEVTLWVSVGRSHAVNFENLVATGQFRSVDEAILDEFSKLPKYTTKCLIYDGDNVDMVVSVSEITDIQKIAIDGKSLEKYIVWPNKTEFTVSGITYEFSQPMPRETYVQLALTAELIKYLDHNLVSDMSAFHQPVGRSNYFLGGKGVKLIDSTYNAHMISMESIINMYSEMQTDHKWVVIGDIIEQGQTEASEHARLGDILRLADFERYILVGRRTQKYTYPQLDAAKSVTFLHPKDAAMYLTNELKGSETVLLKGSQYLEGIVEYLLASPDDTHRLPRQDRAARRRREKWGLV